MVSDASEHPEPSIDDTLDRGRISAPNVTWTGLLTSAPALAAGLIFVILIASGPMERWDYLLAHRWLRNYQPELLWFAQNVLDRVASQAICLPVLCVTALVLARRRRSWRPIKVALLAEFAFLAGVGGMKVVFARPVTYSREPGFFEGGLIDMGAKGISFPSGHAAESILIFGAAVYLLAHYSAASPRLVRRLRWVVALIALNSVVVSFLLGWHWMSDLLGGLLLGGLLLRLITRWDERGRERQGDAAVGA